MASAVFGGPIQERSRCGVLSSRLSKGLCIGGVALVLVVAAIVTGVEVSKHNDSKSSRAVATSTSASAGGLVGGSFGAAANSSTSTVSQSSSAGASQAGSAGVTASKSVPIPVMPATGLPDCVLGVYGFDRPGFQIAAYPDYDVRACYQACFDEPTCAFFNFRISIANISETDQTGCFLKSVDAAAAIAGDLSSHIYDIQACKIADYTPGTCLPTKYLNAAGPLADAYNRTLIAYNTWTDNAMCQYSPGLVEPYLGVVPKPLTLHFDIEVVNPDFTCTTCPVQPTCQIWHPDPKGNYQPYCSATTYGDNFTMTTTFPGDEVALGWGYKLFAHVHYACCCGDSCALNKFYFAVNDFAGVDARLVPAGAEHVAKQLGPTEWKYSIKIAVGGVRWWPVDDVRDILQQRQLFGLSAEPQPWTTRPCCDPSSYPDAEGEL